MPPKELLKYILDIEAIISELEQLYKLLEGDYNNFESSFMAIRTAERNFEIIGEAVRKIREIEPEVQISHIKDIIGMRNIISHAYDAIDPAVLWKVLVKDIPVLKVEIEALKAGNAEL